MRKQNGSWSQEKIEVGRTSELPEPGSFKLIAVREHSLILIRADDGELGCFFNVCRHRGCKLVEGESGKFGKVGAGIVCPFHRWKYGRDGAAVAPARVGLKKIPLQVIEGALFISLGD